MSKEFCEQNNFKILADIGCNNGLYSKIALNNNCDYVVGFDFDINAIDKAYKKALNKNLNFLPLYFDASNPSGNIGWDEKERKSFKNRAKFDAILALAFEHHLTIAKNIPLNQVIVSEFVFNPYSKKLINEILFAPSAKSADKILKRCNFRKARPRI